MDIWLPRALAQVDSAAPDTGSSEVGATEPSSNAEADTAHAGTGESAARDAFDAATEPSAGSKDEVEPASETSTGEDAQPDAEDTATEAREEQPLESESGAGEQVRNTGIAPSIPCPEAQGQQLELPASAGGDARRRKTRA